VAVCTALGTASVHRAAVEAGLRNLLLRVRVASTRTDQIPLSAAELAILDAAIKTLATSLSPDLLSLDQPEREAWPVAQVVLAEQGLGGLDSGALHAFFSRVSIRACSCWREFASVGLPPNIPATGWVLSALAALNVRADSAARFLVREQNRDGWWSLFPVADNPRYASVYGTSWAILGLSAQLRHGLIVGNDSAASAEAIHRGAVWLLNHRDPNSARWRSYPLTDNRAISESLSGLALHTLYQVIPDASAGLTRQWLEGLPREIPSVDAADPAALYDIDTRSGLQNDHFVQIRLPWLLIATADAYPRASPDLRVSAIGWIERALREAGLRDAEIRQEDWWRAELLMALRHLRAATLAGARH